MSDPNEYDLTRTRTRCLSRALAITVITVGVFNPMAGHPARAEVSGGAGLEGLEMDVMNPRESGAAAANRIALPLPRNHGVMNEQPDLIDLANPERSEEAGLDAMRATESEATPSIETPEPAENE
jgi:hypothetical protein